MEEEEINKALSEIEDSLYSAAYNLDDARNELQMIRYAIGDREKTEIKSIENFKTKLRQEGLFTNELEEFIQNYLKFYNK